MTKKVSNSIEEVLMHHRLKVTTLRKTLLEDLLRAKEPLSQADILAKFERRNHQVDRVSIYRNLLQLKKCGLVHEVEVNHYVACAHECRRHAHVVLFCQKCQKHSELHDHQQIQYLIRELSKFEFLDVSQNLMVRGTCQACAVRLTKGVLK